MRWALIIGGIVTDVVESADMPTFNFGGTWVQDLSGTAAPGDLYSEGSTTRPPVVQPVIRRHITRLAFRQRFTLAERIAIELASMHDPDATQQAQEDAAALRVALADQRDALYIDLERQETRDSVLQLEADGLIAEGRAIEILDSPIQEVEVAQ
jgi:hypothetical protein